VINSERTSQGTQQATTNPAFSAGLEAGLLGMFLVLIEQLLRFVLDPERFGLLFASYRILVWIGVGALAVRWLREKGSIERPKQIQAGILAGLMTGLATGILMVIFSLIKSEPVESLDLPERISPGFIKQVGAVAMICCYGLPTAVIGTAFSYGGSLLMRLFVGTEKPSTEATSIEQPRALMLDAFLARRELPEELKPAIAALDDGDKSRSLSMLGEILEKDPHHEQACLWMATMMDDPVRQKECVQRALSINPDNETASKMLAALEHVTIERM
jgi:hypothetical protein